MHLSNGRGLPLGGGGTHAPLKWTGVAAGGGHSCTSQMDGGCRWGGGGTHAPLKWTGVAAGGGGALMHLSNGRGLPLGEGRG